MLMGRLKWERDKSKAGNEARMDEVRSNLPKLFQPPVSSLAELVVRLEEAGITAPDIDAEIGAEFTVQDALNRLFNVFDEGRLDPLNYAAPDAMAALPRA